MQSVPTNANVLPSPLGGWVFILIRLRNKNITLKEGSKPFKDLNHINLQNAGFQLGFCENASHHSLIAENLLRN